MNYVASVFSLALDSKHVGLPCILHLHSESLITRGRNVILIKFLSEESFTHLFWIDSDIAFKSEDVFRLLLADRDIAAGVYPMKRFNWPAQGLPAGKVAEAPTGFMVIKRHVLTHMMKKYPELNYVPDGPPNNPQRHLYWRFFDCMVDPDSGRYLSEDYAFCRRWRDIGGKVHVDLQCKLMHLGQHLFRGDLAESLRLQGRW